MIKNITIFFYIVLIVILGAATFVEVAQGTRFVEKNVYHAIYFCIIWGILSLLTVIVLIRHKMWKRFPVFLLHISFLTILAGALTTWLDGQKGYIHLRTGIGSDRFTLVEEEKDAELPFTVRLDSFNIECYPGTQAPKDYISHITCIDRERTDSLYTHRKISMNNIWIYRGYRFYQTSFDEDHKGSFLTVNHDTWGTGITYSGYLLLAISMIAVLFSGKGTFRKLLRYQSVHLRNEKREREKRNRKIKFQGLLIILFTVFSPTLSAGPQNSERLPALKISQACSLSRLQVIYNDRVAPLNTLARDFLLKLTGKDHYKGLTPEQVIGGWLLHPERWREEPVIYIKDARLRQKIGLESKFARLSDLFDGDSYRLQSLYGKGDRKLDKSILETDEKVGLISMLVQGTLIQPIIDKKDAEPLSEMKIKAELLYNKIPFCKILFLFNLTAGILGLIYLSRKHLKRTQGNGRGKTIAAVTETTLYTVTFFHLIGYVLHWYIAGHIPLSNGYETMLFMGLVILFLTCLLHRRYRFMLPFGLLLSGFTLLVAYLGQKNPQITPLMPVLHSPWLSSHVSLIMMSYTLFAFMMANSISALILIFVSEKDLGYRYNHSSEIKRLTVLNRIMLYPAVYFLGIGIFLGAVWANESWGRYWAWDPKEVWALITFMIYGIVFHMKSIKVLGNPKFFHSYLVLAFLAILMTYFGVNYFLGGMHSYA